MPFIRSESCSFIWQPNVVTWNVFMRDGRLARGSLREVDRPRLADDRHLDLPRVLELGLDLARDGPAERHRGVVADRLGRDDDPDLAAGLHRVDLLHALVAGGDVLELAQALDVLLERLATGAGPRPGQR